VERDLGDRRRDQRARHEQRRDEAHASSVRGGTQTRQTMLRR
jgi:hypothetical protein